MSAVVRLVHFSDWHGKLFNLPEADVYVCTGDLLNSYPKMKKVRGHDRFGCFGPTYAREIIPSREEAMQKGWFEKKFIEKGRTLRCFFPESCRDNPVVAVRGNHDFTGLAKMFGGEVFEISHDATCHRTYCGLKFGGFRGVPVLVREWSDEFEQADLADMARALPDDLDVVCTHAPPHGILDDAFGERIGIHGLTSWFNVRWYDWTLKCPRLFCFGHVHNQHGIEEHEHDDPREGVKKVIFSNAATTKQVIEL